MLRNVSGQTSCNYLIVQVTEAIPPEGDVGADGGVVLILLIQIVIASTDCIHRWFPRSLRRCQNLTHFIARCAVAGHEHWKTKFDVHRSGIGTESGKSVGTKSEDLCASSRGRLIRNVLVDLGANPWRILSALVDDSCALIVNQLGKMLLPWSFGEIEHSAIDDFSGYVWNSLETLLHCIFAPFTKLAARLLHKII